MSAGSEGDVQRVDQPVPVEVALDLEPGRSLEPVGRLVAAGIAGRLGVTVDRILRLERAVDFALRGPGTGGARSLRLIGTGNALQVALGPLDARRTEARKLEHVLSLLVDHVTMRRSGPGEVWVDMWLPLDSRRAES